MMRNLFQMMVAIEDIKYHVFTGYMGLVGGKEVKFVW